MKKTQRNEPVIDPEEILEGIRGWVAVESPSHDAAAVNRMVDLAGKDMAAIGAKLERTPGRDGYGDILKARMPWGEGKGILVLSHLDTVHPIGMAQKELKFRREGDSVFGAGIYDMKGGAYIAHYALRHLVRSGRQTPLPVTFLFIPEEEVGSPTSRQAIEAEARNAKYVLVTEPARDGGKIVTGRRGAARYDIRVKGRASHAGLRHEDGRSAIKEMARQILVVEDFTDYKRAITTSVGLIQGGTGINVVPAECTAGVDMRFPDKAVFEAVHARFMALKPIGPDVQVHVDGGETRPAYAKNEGIAKLFDHARALAKEIGFELGEVTQTGGGSDGNFTGAMGIPTLDGLGVDGKGAHTDYEQMYYSSLVPRTRLFLRLLETLE
ncbi:MAG: M20/M25/M40 family metallo-hydrolase [Alphaproteobacteria bacterium]|nr:M20/M25/M40 family metallo-hydrolase [Alphaproteobacteria bacterium]